MTPKPIQFVSLRRGRIYTPAQLRPMLMRRLRVWKFLEHLDTLAKRRAMADAWLGAERFLRHRNGMIPAAVLDDLEFEAVANAWPDEGDL